MSQIQRSQQEDTNVQQYFAHLDRWDKVADWVYGGLIIGCLLLTISAGIVLLS